MLPLDSSFRGQVIDMSQLHLHLNILLVLWVEPASLLVTVQRKVINGRFMSRVHPGMLMLLSRSRDTVCSDSYLMETVKSTTPCLQPRTLQRVCSHRAHPLAEKYIREIFSAESWKLKIYIEWHNVTDKAVNLLHFQHLTSHIPDLV